MMYFLLMLCAFAEGFLLRFLVGLIRESQYLAPHKEKADRMRRGPAGQSGKLIPMNPGKTQDENVGKAIGKRTVLIMLGALLFTLPLHGQRTASDASSAAVQEGTRSDQPIPPAVMEELEAMKKRIEQLEAELKSRTAAEAAPAAGTPAGMSVAMPTAAPAEAPLTQTSTATSTKQGKIAPFSDWDWTWLNGNPRNKDVAFDSKFFTPEIRADITYNYDFNKPIDNSMGGSSELFRSNEIQLEQLGIGGDFHYDNVRARFMTQFGMYSDTTPRNDPSPAKGQWDLDDCRPLHSRGIWRLPHQRVERNQHRRGHLHVVCRPVQLL